ncbi:hypothetical protein EVAR_103619_1 [Eumeta japonica]|uniref:Uncharacterized protein n=1 Tax=Eumeta variegata TaxID=151549 RepID=A0A4C1SRP9_EUMVA|nr:hypothetical protein EVAR_103619_1 [Eumeta japonica]
MLGEISAIALIDYRLMCINKRRIVGLRRQTINPSAGVVIDAGEETLRSDFNRWAPAPRTSKSRYIRAWEPQKTWSSQASIDTCNLRKVTNFKEEQGECFHQEIKVMENRCRERWGVQLMADYI